MYIAIVKLVVLIFVNALYKFPLLFVVVVVAVGVLVVVVEVVVVVTFIIKSCGDRQQPFGGHLVTRLVGV